MGRKVSVELEADIAGFVAPVETAKKSVDDLGDKVDKLDRELDKIPPDAAKAAAAMKLLGGEADATSQKLSTIGDKRTNLAALDSKIRSIRAEVRGLADEFAKTGDVDVFRKLGDAQGRLSALTKIRKEVAESLEQGVKDAAEWPGLAAVGARYAAVLAPTLGTALVAALGGAIVGATGLGVAGAGLAGAVLGDPQRFQGAWSVAIRHVKDDFLKATQPFTEDVYSGLARIGPLVDSWHLDKIFKDAAKYSDPLLDGIEGFSTGLVKGIGALVNKGEPAVHALSDSMTILGQASESAFESIADGAEGGAYALKDLATGVGGVIQLFGGLVGAAEKAYAVVHDHPVLTGIATVGASVPLSLYTDANGHTKELKETQHGLELQAIAAGHAFSAQGDDLTVLSQKLNSATVTSDTLAAAMTNKLFTAIMNVDQATLGVAESLTRVGESIEQNGRQLDIHTKKGQANRESILSSVTANMQLYQAQVAAGMSAEDAAAQYRTNTQALEDQLRKAHLTQEQIDGLIGKYRDIPATVNTTIAIEGLTQAINNLDETLRLMAGLKSKDVYVTVHTVYTDSGYRKTGSSQLAGGMAHGGIRRAAVGMVIPPSDPGTTLVGEPQTGGELLLPLKGISQSRAMMLAQVAGDSYGFSVASGRGGGGGVGVTIAFTGNTDQPMASWFMGAVRTGLIQIKATV